MEGSKAVNRKEEMFGLVESYRLGNQNRRDFCAQHNIPLSTFSYWQRKYRESEDQESGFIALETDRGSLSGGSGHLRLELPGGVTLHLAW